jgi:hypothetical protein
VHLDGHDVNVINADGSQSHNTTRDKVPNRVVDWLVGQKFIKEGADWPVLPHSIDPVVAEKVRRIESSESGLGWTLWDRLNTGPLDVRRKVMHSVVLVPHAQQGHQIIKSRIMYIAGMTHRTKMFHQKNGRQVSPPARSRSD